MTDEQLADARECLLAVRRLAVLAGNFSSFTALSGEEIQRFKKLFRENSDAVLDGFDNLQQCVETN